VVKVGSRRGGNTDGFSFSPLSRFCRAPCFFPYIPLVMFLFRRRPLFFFFCLSFFCADEREFRLAFTTLCPHHEVSMFVAKPVWGTVLPAKLVSCVPATTVRPLETPPSFFLHFFRFPPSSPILCKKSRALVLRGRLILRRSD